MKHWEWNFDGTDASGDPIDVEYQFDCGDDEVTYYRDGSGYPGSAPSIEIVRFIFKGVDVTDLIWAIVSTDAIDDLEFAIQEYEEQGGGFDIEDFIE